MTQIKRVSFSLEYMWNNKELFPFLAFKSKVSSIWNLGWSNSLIGLNGSTFIAFKIAFFSNSTLFVIYVVVFMILYFVINACFVAYSFKCFATFSFLMHNEFRFLKNQLCALYCDPTNKNVKLVFKSCCHTESHTESLVLSVVRFWTHNFSFLIII